MRGARKVLLGGSLLLTITLAAGILVGANWIGFNYYARFDWTRSRVYSISQQTRQVIARVNQPLKIIIFLPAEGQQSSPVYDEVRELADRYAAAAPQYIKIEYVDPLRNQMLAMRVAQQYGVRASTIIFEYGEGESARKHFVEEARLADFDYSRMAFGERPKVEAFKGEEVFTTAIKGLVDDKKMRVVFTAGHGEASFKGNAGQDFALAADALRRENFEVEEWTGLAADSVPDGTDILIVGGPKKSLLANEVEAIRKYLAAGGKVLFMLDPIVAADKKAFVSAGLDSVLSEWGVRVDEDIVVDPNGSLPLFGPETIFTNRTRVHPITRGLEAFPIIIPLCRSIGISPVSGQHEGYESSLLVETSAEGWGENDLSELPRVKKDSKDIPGPVSLAVAVGPRMKRLEDEMEKSVPGKKSQIPVRAPESGTRIVAFGDSEFASNDLFDRNNAYFLASVNWLAVREESLGIPPKKTGKVALRLSRDQIFNIEMIIYLLLPGAAIAAGLAVWWRRRN